MRPIFCGNFEYETRQSDLERLFSKFGRVERVDMKSGFAFVYFEDERVGCQLNGPRGNVVGIVMGKLQIRGQLRPFFVINFDPVRTKVHDIERHFEPYGKLLNVRIRRNFAFVQFETQEDATKALECAHMSKILDKVVSVEYALRDDDERGGMHESPRRNYGMRGDSPYRRSHSPGFRRSRPSPDYGPGRRSPVYDWYNGPSHDRGRSPDYSRFRSRSPVRR
ncbi:Serine/arginine-rich splicing factor rs31 [Salvia divinorum]|uniref:Serine/arginine-rich splicing factor rs31 n=1 Tax=Salvia divinorum TaxID=28513 RepID=A0ABD1GZW9_SALDI